LTDLKKLERRLGFEFDDLALLEQALTHKSHSGSNNERLEFLGDAVLGYVIAHALFDTYPDAGEDSLTLMRASLVRKDTLYELAGELGLGEFLRLGPGERKSGGRDRASILADALEAVIGAIRLDGGVEAARQAILQLFAQRLDSANDEDIKDPKTRLQELLQSRKLDLPEYEVIEMTGSEHRRHFLISCRVDALSLITQGEGHSRREAEKSAAQAMLTRMQDDN
jgi:ribonuclease III